ncbi:unnamed protein product, partial [Cyprideis torosa]
AQIIAQKARDEIKAQFDDATAKADAQIAAKAAEAEMKISEIRASALENVEVVAKDTAAAIVQSLGGKVDDKAITAAVAERLKGAAPAMAASGPFFSLKNTDFVVLVGFLLFLGVLIYYKVPGLLGGVLDKRAQEIRSELDEARALREEAQALLASYERKAHEVQDQADRIVAHAKQESELAAEQA